MSTTTNMSLNELHVLQERWKKEDEELQRCMEEAEEQEVEQRHEEERVEAERKAAEVEEVWKAKAGKNRKLRGPSMKMGHRRWRGLPGASRVTCAERRRSSAIGRTSTFFFLCLQFS